MCATKHKPDCKMSYGRKDPTCPRCIELLNGAPARDGWQKNYYAEKKRIEANRIKAIREHDCVKCNCGPVCTAFDW